MKIFVLGAILFLIVINLVRTYSFFVITDIHLDFSYDCRENVTSACRTTLQPSAEKQRMILHPDRNVAREYIENSFGEGKKRTSFAPSSKKCAPFARYGCDTSIGLAGIIIILVISCSANNSFYIPSKQISLGQLSPRLTKKTKKDHLMP